MHTMKTGCDDLWNHQNRYVPVLSLMKNDNYSHAVLTDNYKQVTSGEQTNFFSSYIQPHHSIASSHQNDHCRVTDSQCLWLPSVQPPSFGSSYVNNFHTPETFTSQSNNLGYSPKSFQVQQNYGLIYSNNPEVNTPQLCSNQTHGCNNNSNQNVVAEKGESINQQTPRIRVRDISSLQNKNNMFNTLLENHSNEHRARQQNERAPNYSTGDNTISNSESLTEFSVYDNIGLPATNQHCPPYYNHVATEQPILYNQHHFNNSYSIYQQNAQFVTRNQYQLSDKNLPLNTFKTNTSIPLKKINSGNIHKSKNQNTQWRSCDTLLVNKRMKLLHNQNSISRSNSKVTNNTAHGVGVNETSKYDTALLKNSLVTPIKYQKQFPQRNNVNLVNSNSLCSTLNSNSLTDVNSKIRNLSNQIVDKNSVLKTAVPLTSKTSFTSFKETTIFKENSMLSLPCLFESNKLNEINSSQINSQKCEAMDLSLPHSKDGLVDNQTPTIANVCSSSQNICPSYSGYNSDCTRNSETSILSHLLRKKEPFVDLKNSVITPDLNSDKTSKSLSSEICEKDKTDATEAVLSTNSVVNVLKAKEKNRIELISRQENTTEHVNRQENRIEDVNRQKNTIEHVNRQENTIEHVNRQENVTEHVDRQENTIEHVNRQENRIEDVSRQEKTIEHINRQENRTEHVDSQENTIEHVNRQENRTEHVSKQENTIEHVNRQENRTEHVSKQENTIENVNRQENIIEHVSMQENIIEHVSMQENTIEHVNRQENRTEHVSKQENTIEDVNRQENRTEHVSKQENRTEHVSKQENTIEDVSKLENVTERVSRQENGIEFSRIGPDENISKLSIKTEENVERFAVEKHKADVQQLEKQSSLEKTFSTTQDTEVFNSACMDVIKLERSDPKLKTDSSLIENSSDPKNTGKITESDNLKNISNRKEKKNKVKMKKKETNSSQKKKYRSKINRDKLEMLIEFLKKDEEPDQIRTYEEKDSTFGLTNNKNDNANEDKKDLSTNHSRRKLKKTCVVKNKNNKREMISLISYKAPRVELLKDSPKAPEVFEVTPDSKESRTSFEEGKSKSNGFPEKLLEFNNLLPVTQNNEIPKIEMKPAIKKEVSLEKNRSVHEKKNIISIIRAFRKLQTHSCTNCHLVSPTESFWINVMSGELKCLRCFTKMDLKTEASNFNLIKTPDKDTDAEVAQNEKNSKDVVKNSIEKFFTEGLLPDVQNESERKIVSEEESIKSCKTENFKKQDPTGIEQSSNESDSDENHKVITKSEKSIRKSVFEEKKILDHPKPTKKDSPRHTKSRSNSEDEFFLHKTLTVGDHSKKEEKQTVKLSDKKIVKKAKESSEREIDTQKKSLRQETSEKSIPSKTSKENHLSKIPQAEEQKALPQLFSANESKSKSSRTSEKSGKTESRDQLKKRKGSHEDLPTQKVFFVENHIKKEAKPMIHSSGKTQVTTVTKKDCSEYKTLNEEKRNSRDSSDRFKKNSLSREVETKQIIHTSGKTKTQEIDYRNVKLSVHTNKKPRDSEDVARRKSKEKSTSQKTIHSKEQSSEVINSTEKHRNGIALGEEEKRNFKEIRKHFLEKIPKVSENDRCEKIVTSSEKPKQFQKPENATKLLKEKINLKVSNTPIKKSEQKEPYESKKIQLKNILEDKNEQKGDKKVKMTETNKKESEDKTDKKIIPAEYKRQADGRHVKTPHTEGKARETATSKREVAPKDCRWSLVGSRPPIQFIEFLEKNKK